MKICVFIFGLFISLNLHCFEVRGESCPFKKPLWEREREISLYYTEETYTEGGVKYHVYKTNEAGLKIYFNQLGQDYIRCLKKMDALFLKSCEFDKDYFNLAQLEVKNFVHGEYTSKSLMIEMEQEKLVFLQKNRDNFALCLAGADSSKIITNLSHKDYDQNRDFYDVFFPFALYLKKNGHLSNLLNISEEILGGCATRDGCEYLYKVDLLGKHFQILKD